jgi:hypothetical protein
MADILGFRLMSDSKYPMEEGLDAYMDFLSYGLLARREDIPEKSESEMFYCEVTDNKGVKTIIREVRFDTECYLTGRIGQAEVKVDCENIFYLSRKDAPSSTVVLNMKNGEELVMKVDEKTNVSGKCSLALFTISLKDVSHIDFLSNRTASPNDEGEIQNTITATKVEDDKKHIEKQPK